MRQKVTDMDSITKFLRASEGGAITRRQLFEALGLSATAAVAAAALPRNVFAAIAGQAAAASKSFPVTTVNHLSYASTDYKKVRDFYVDFFGMRDVWDDGTKCQVDCGPASAPNSHHSRRFASPTRVALAWSTQSPIASSRMNTRRCSGFSASHCTAS